MYLFLFIEEITLFQMGGGPRPQGRKRFFYPTTVPLFLEEEKSGDDPLKWLFA
jgi:hypothetical protein